MTFEYGPVEFHLIEFNDNRPHPDVIEAMKETFATGAVRLLDIVFISKDEAGEVSVYEVEEVTDAGVEILEKGLAGSEDIDLFAEDIAPGHSAAIVAIELVWAKNFASALNATGGFVAHSETVPAPVVNQLLAENAE
jgi:hypothetical protein